MRGGEGRHKSDNVCWSSGELLAGGDDRECPNRFCRLGCRVIMSCFVSIGVFCALYVCLFLEMWIIIKSYMRNISPLGKGEVVVDFYYSFVLGFDMCRRLSVQGVVLPMLLNCRCECISRSAIFPVWLVFIEASTWSCYVFGGRSLSTRPCRRGCSGSLDFLCPIAQICVGREAMWSIFVRPSGGS